jgi:histidinol-phosphate/aromatic aminotransferase/cobyric acid decarboxylase-like protein
VATRLVLICNPNSPTSTAVGLVEVVRSWPVSPATCA